MYPVSAAYLAQIRADARRVYAKTTIDFTNWAIDQSIQATASELANVSYPGQTADGLTETSYKYASLDGTTILDGTYHPAPSAVEAATVQMGWWGSQLAQADGTFVSPFPTLIITHAARPIWSLSVIGDSKRGEWPVDWFIRLYDAANTLLHTETVTGNTSMTWSKEITSVLDVTRQELEIRRWSHAGRQAKILEFFTSIQETYDGEQIVSLSLLEEREVGQAALPVGNISANELELRMQNIDRRFDAGNPASPLRGLVKPNRRVRAWLGVADSLTVQDDVTAGTLNNVVALPDGRLELASVPGPTFIRASDAYRADGSLVLPGMSRFETGRFAQAAMVEEGVSNLHSNPRLETAVTGWAGIYLCTLTRTGERAIFGAWSARIVAGDPAANWFANTQGDLTFVCIPSAVYAFSIWVYSATSNVGITRIEVNHFRADGSYLGFDSSSAFSARRGEWERLTVVFTSRAEAGRLSFRLRGSDTSAPGDTYWATAAQIEQRGYVTSFHQSTRSPELLTLPTAGVLSPTEGTVELYAYENGISRWAYLWDSDGVDRFLCAKNDNHQYVVFINGIQAIAVSRPSIGWHFIAVTWSGTLVRLFIDGSLVGNTVIERVVSFSGVTTLYIGRRFIGLNHWNSLIDDFRISTRARTDAEILTGYNSNAPLPPDTDTTYLLRFDGHLPTRIYRPAGQRVSPVYDISSTARPLSILVNWQESVPAGTSFTMEANVSTDGGSTWRGWQAILNGGALLVSDLTNARLQLRQTFATNADMSATAGIEDTTVTLTLDQAGEMVPLGVYWTGDWHTDAREGYVKTTARDRMELLRTSTYSASQVAVNTTLYDLAVAVLQNAGLTAAEYLVDTELQGYAIPYAWFEPQSHREALRKIAEACLGQAYCDRSGKVVVDGPSALARQGAFLLPSFPALVASENITADSYFDRSQPLRWGEVANYVEIDTQPLRPDVVTEVHRSNEPVPIAAGETKTLTVYYNHVPSIEAVASLVDAPVGATITAATYYAWGADVTVNSPTAGTFVLVINAKPMKVLNKERAIAQDDASIREHGTLKYTFPGNPLVQSLIMAQRIADTLLRFYRDPRRDVEVDWRGNPALTLGDVVVVPDFDARHHYYVVRQTLDYAGALRSQLTGRKV